MKRILVLNYEFPPLGGGASPVSYELKKLGFFPANVGSTGFYGAITKTAVEKYVASL